MSACRRAGHGTAKGHEWNSRLAQVSNEGSSLLAVRVNRDVHCVSVVESQTIMRRGLTKRTHRKRVTEVVEKEFLDFARIRKRPWRVPVEPDKAASFTVSADGERRQFYSSARLGNRDVGFGQPFFILID